MLLHQQGATGVSPPLPLEVPLSVACSCSLPLSPDGQPSQGPSRPASWTPRGLSQSRSSWEMSRLQASGGKDIPFSTGGSRKTLPAPLRFLLAPLGWGLVAPPPGIAGGTPHAAHVLQHPSAQVAKATMLRENDPRPRIAFCHVESCNGQRPSNLCVQRNVTVRRPRCGADAAMGLEENPEREPHTVSMGPTLPPRGSAWGGGGGGSALNARHP